MKTYKIKIYKTNRKVPVSKWIVSSPIVGLRVWDTYVSDTLDSLVTDLTKKPKGDNKIDLRPYILHDDGSKTIIDPADIYRLKQIPPITLKGIKPHKLGIFENLINRIRWW